MATLKLEIVTPEAKVYSEDVDMVTLPGVEGEMGIFPGHAPILSTLKPGVVTVPGNGNDDLGARTLKSIWKQAGFAGRPNRHGGMR